ncbi:MAG TPA: C-type lectin domain-containing protein [Phycisphaerae bacterium]|nr:C-type lectin domain-containing protein [Phycisphaerae bacterium]
MNRRSLFKALILAAAAIQARTSLGGIIAGPIVSPVNGHTYYFTSEEPWPQAEADAVTMGGHLVTIRNSAENDWLVNTFTPLTNRIGVHIGFNDISQEGTWVWSSGESSSYVNWGPGEPNNLGNEDWGELFLRDYNALHAGQWNDGQVNDNGIVEVLPEPQVIGFLLITVGLWPRLRRAAN